MHVKIENNLSNKGLVIGRRSIEGSTFKTSWYFCRRGQRASGLQNRDSDIVYHSFMKYLLLVLIGFILLFFNLFCRFFVFFSFLQVMFEGEHSGISPHGDISIDDVSFTPECRPAPHGTVLYLLVLDIIVLCREMYATVFVWILRDSLLLSCFLSFFKS